MKRRPPFTARPAWLQIGCLLLYGVLIAGAGGSVDAFAQSGPKAERNAPAVQPPSRPRNIGSRAAKPQQAAPSEPSTAPPPAAAPSTSDTRKEEGPREQPGESACMRALRAAHGSRIRVSDAKMPSDPGCLVVDPIVMSALALRTEAGHGHVVFEPPVTIGCAMAQRISDWLDTSVQPLAQGHFDRDLTALRVGGGHECRRRNRSAAGPLSEHSTGQALDIFAFELGKPKAEPKPESRPEPKPDTAKHDGAAADAVTVVVEKPAGSVQDRFLAAVRQSACGAFTTSLGPGSDAAHANHLHVDIQERRSPSTHFCQ